VFTIGRCIRVLLTADRANLDIDTATNWVQIMPGKKGNILLHFYGCGESWFDKARKSGEFEGIQ
jgi:hypothetical protein